MKSLIIENSRLYRQLNDSILGQQNFENDICSTLHSAYEFLESTQYDLIMTNHFLEDGSGIDVTKFCSTGLNKDTPILLLTSDSPSEFTDFPDRISEIIPKKNIQQLSDQIIHFIEIKLDPTF
jgi:DNA-binding response OmpR family regulator